MADTTRRICEICGEEINEWEAHELVTGRNKKYFCQKCWDNGQMKVEQYKWARRKVAKK